jgi:putative colanic acid biosynthesis acetyltransferase WcaF
MTRERTALPEVAAGAEAEVPASVAAAGRGRSPYTTSDKARRLFWSIVSTTLFRCSFHNWYGWRRMILRVFGARIGQSVRIRRTVRIEMPWNLRIGDESSVGDHAILYSLGPITIGKLVSISQYAHLCAGTHDYTTRAMTLLRPPIVVEDEAWIAADAFVGPGVTIGTRSVIAARATVVNDVPPDQVVGGNPARFIKPRILSP